jgi:hypothetical protein
MEESNFSTWQISCLRNSSGYSWLAEKYYPAAQKEMVFKEVKIKSSTDWMRLVLSNEERSYGSLNLEF